VISALLQISVKQARLVLDNLTSIIPLEFESESNIVYVKESQSKNMVKEKRARERER